MAKTAKTAKSTFTVSAEEEAFLVALRNLIGAGGAGDVEEEEEDEDEDDEEDEDEGEELEAPVREEIESLKIKDLRERAAQYGIEETKKADILAAFEDLYEEEEEDDEDEDDEDEEGFDRDELEEMDLKDLRKLAKENGMSAADAKKADQDDLVDFLMGETEEDDEDEDDEDEDDEEEEVLDEDALKAMTQKDLLALAKELDIKVPAALKKSSAANKKKLVNLILDSGEEE